ncbi:hypothetical protein DPMN_141402 [Dreissena polymorpha]|uniref:Secreted protein n=1 Tax=Dreissena polymorpha TaxID=45954 RepID=A0A9D4JJV6_DREPO|nr:hypothetical protein DPMN_141402 [Dreissena polymorpha]
MLVAALLLCFDCSVAAANDDDGNNNDDEEDDDDFDDYADGDDDDDGDNDDCDDRNGNCPKVDSGFTTSPEEGRGQRRWQRRRRAWRTLGRDTGQDFDGVAL